MMTNFEKESEFVIPLQGEQSAMVHLDMKEWALKNGLWDTEYSDIIDYKDTIILYAIDRGWLQSNFTGLEMPHEEC
tara:strand:- start:3908 stop:4135 length:228 start_codon:yes stop_codon:yes gene_type:complete